MPEKTLSPTDYAYRSRVFVSDRYGHVCHLMRHRIVRRTATRLYFSRYCEILLDEGSWIPHWGNVRYKPHAYGAIPRRLFERLGKASHERDVYYQVPPKEPAHFRRPSEDFLRRELALDVQTLRRMMQKAHPDKGGTVDEFRRVRILYERAKARAEREEDIYGPAEMWDLWPSAGRPHPRGRSRSSRS